MGGVIILIVRHDLIAEGRLYMESAEIDGEDVAAAVQELFKPPSG